MIVVLLCFRGFKCLFYDIRL